MSQNKPAEEWKELNNARMICLLFAHLINRMIEKSDAEQPLPNERIQNYLQRVVRQADNLNRIIEKMLDFSRNHKVSSPVACLPTPYS